MRRFSFIFFFLLLMLTSVGNAETIFLEGFGEKQPVRVLNRDGIDYMSASDFFSAAGAKLSWDNQSWRLTVDLNGHTLEFLLESIFARLDRQVVNLIHPPVYQVDDLYLPTDRTLELLALVLPRTFTYDRTRKTLVAVGEGFNIAAINAVGKVNGTLLEIVLTEHLAYDLFVTEGNWLNLTILDGRVDVERLTRQSSSRFVRRVRAFQFDNSAQISIQLKGKVREFHHNYASSPHRIQVSIEDIDFSPDDHTQLFGLDLSRPDSIDIIVIDPGHGGEYDGAIGKGGLKEKDVVLDIALRLEALFDRNTRFTPVLTRRNDRTVGLDERAQIANNSNGDLFLSIHANASKKKKAQGCETFFLAAAETDEARVTEILENSDFRLELPDSNGDDDDLDFILLDLLQTEYLGQSQLLAELTQDELSARLNIKSRGINQAGFVVLNKVYMPSVLIETAFISNKVEEKLFARDDFKQKIAEAIYAAVVRFADSFKREMTDVGR